MKTVSLAEVLSYLDCELNVASFDDVANNSLQLDREGDAISCVAFGVDASVDFLTKAADAGAELCVVHHGISWGGGIRRIISNDYRVIKTAMSRNLAIYGVHLPLDANKKYGNNWEIARLLKLVKIVPAFSYHGNVIGVKGVASKSLSITLGKEKIRLEKGQLIGVCSGGAGDFAVEAKEEGCDLFITGEANWADEVAAKNMDVKMVCCGHYETEIFGVKALSKALAKDLKIKTVFIA